VFELTDTPSSFDKLRMRATFDPGATVEILILSLSKDEDFSTAEGHLQHPYPLNLPARSVG
jgi:hypothetical protein